MNTLTKITYTTLQEFLEQINRNFAIIQNSPLYKGLPGNQGNPGIGIQGQRGTNFLFVNVSKFSEIFPTEVYAGSHVTLEFLNSKLISEETKLLQCFEIDSFANNDVIVLTNSVMLSYNLALDKFSNTGLAFNSQSNFISQIENQIEAYVQYYVANNPTLNSIEDIFDSFKTIAKNYTETNNMYINGNSNSSSIYVPFFPGLTTTTGQEMENHKYFGFSDTMFPQTNDGTFVLGSIKKYIQLLMNTLSPSEVETYTSDYAPGVGNIPALVILQDTLRNGIMIGKKTDTNLFKFSSIFKNADDDLVLQSSQGPEPAPNEESVFSRLLISNTRMYYAKHAVLGSLDITRNLSVTGQIDSKGIRTGQYTESQLAIDTEIGTPINNGDGARTYYTSEFQRFKRFTNCFLYTNENGDVQKDYTLEGTVLNNNLLPGTTQITVVPVDDKKIITSKYANYIIQKLNILASLLQTDYVTVTQLGNSSLQNISITQDLLVGATEANPVFEAKTTQTLAKPYNIRIGRDNNDIVKINTRNWNFPSMASRFLYIDENGNLNPYYLYHNGEGLNVLELTDNNQLSQLPAVGGGGNLMLSQLYGNHIITKINNFMQYVDTNYINSVAIGNYYTKDEFIGNNSLPVIDAIRLYSIIVDGFGNNATGVFFSASGNVDNLTGTINLGAGFTNSNVVIGGNIKYQKATNTIGGASYPKMLVFSNTSGQEGVSSMYNLDNFACPDSTATALEPIAATAVGTLLTDTLANVGLRIPNMRFIRYLVTRINNLLTYLTTTNLTYSNGSHGTRQDGLNPGTTYLEFGSQVINIKKKGGVVYGYLKVKTKNTIPANIGIFVGNIGTSSADRPDNRMLLAASSIQADSGDNATQFYELNTIKIETNGDVILYVSQNFVQDIGVNFTYTV